MYAVFMLIVAQRRQHQFAMILNW